MHQLAPTPVVVFTNQTQVAPQNTEVHTLIKTAYDKYQLREYREAIVYCNQILKQEPKNPNALCIKGVSEKPCTIPPKP